MEISTQKTQGQSQKQRHFRDRLLGRLARIAFKAIPAVMEASGKKVELIHLDSAIIAQGLPVSTVGPLQKHKQSKCKAYSREGSI